MPFGMDIPGVRLGNMGKLVIAFRMEDPSAQVRRGWTERMIKGDLWHHFSIFFADRA